MNVHIWIAHTAIGLKRVLFAFAGLSALGYLFFPTQHGLTMYLWGFASGLILSACYAAYMNGINRIIRTFSIGGITFDVRDHINLKQPRKSFRGIFDHSHGSWVSRMYRTPQDTWAYMDVVRQALRKEKRRSERAVLVLGAGGGSLAYTISCEYPGFTVDAVEISDTMIGIAKRYFAPDQPTPAVRFIREDAFSYIRSRGVGRAYDVLIVDLFNGSDLPPKILSTHFIRSLKGILAENGMIFVNFGRPTDAVRRAIRMYASCFPEFTAYAVHKNIIGVNRGLHMDPSVVTVSEKRI